MAVRYVQNLRTAVRTSHLEPYRTSLPYFSSIFEVYRTNVPYPYHYKNAYRTSVPYFLVKIEAYRTVLPSLVTSAVATVEPGAPYPPNDSMCPPISVYSECFLEHHVTTRQQALMEKRIKIFKDSSCLKFSRFFCKISGHQLLYINVTQ